MKSGLTPLFNYGEIEELFNKHQKSFGKQIVKLLCAAGEEFVATARNYGSYKDQTGNLRSSIGYIVAQNGEVIAENFKESDKGSNRSLGKEMGYKVASDISLAYTDGPILVGVAGMNYAAAVEAKGYEVVTGASAVCEKYLREAINEMFNHG